MPSTQQEAAGVIWIEDDVLRAGFTQFPNVLLSSPAISATAKLVDLGLLSFAWQQGSCWPGQDTLGGRVALSRASVQRALYELKKAGLLVVTRRGRA